MGGHKAQNNNKVRMAGLSVSGTDSVGNQVSGILGPPKDQLMLPAVLGGRG